MKLLTEALKALKPEQIDAAIRMQMRSPKGDHEEFVVQTLVQSGEFLEYLALLAGEFNRDPGVTVDTAIASAFAVGMEIGILLQAARTAGEEFAYQAMQDFVKHNGGGHA